MRATNRSERWSIQATAPRPEYVMAAGAVRGDHHGAAAGERIEPVWPGFRERLDQRFQDVARFLRRMKVIAAVGPVHDAAKVLALTMPITLP